MSSSDAAEDARVTQAYHERNRAALLAASVARALGLRAGIYQDYEESDPRFSAVLQIDLPTGQVTFHLDAADERWMLFSPDWDIVNNYDGHGDEEKWNRVKRFMAEHSVRSSLHVVVESFRQSMASLEEAIDRARRQRQESAAAFRLKRADLQRQHRLLQNLREVLISTAGIPATVVDGAIEKAEKLTEEQWHASEEER